MDTKLINKKFEQVGARVKFRPLVRRRWQTLTTSVLIDVAQDRRGEYFDIQASDDAKVDVLDARPRNRHLLLMVRQPNEADSGRPARNQTIKDKFLCGHDERHWFVAGIPETSAASNVKTALDALKPVAIQNLERRKKGAMKNRHRRKTSVFVRQGEWFFVPVPELNVDNRLILTREPISRGLGSKPHICEFLYREGGETVYVCGRYPNGVTANHYRKLLKKDRGAAKWGWTTMRRNPTAYVRGKVSHPDHATIKLPCWSRVEMNTEHQSRAMASVAFLD